MISAIKARLADWGRWQKRRSLADSVVEFCNLRPTGAPGCLPSSYLPATVRNVSPITKGDFIGLGFNLEDIGIIRLRLPVASAIWLAEALNDHLKALTTSQPDSSSGSETERRHA